MMKLLAAVLGVLIVWRLWEVWKRVEREWGER
jgi:hypothetical protein